LKSIYEHERDCIVEEFSDVHKVLADLDPSFKGMCNKISKIQGIWLLVSTGFARPPSAPDLFAFSCQKTVKLSQAHYQI